MTPYRCSGSHWFRPGSERGNPNLLPRGRSRALRGRMQGWGRGGVGVGGTGYPVCRKEGFSCPTPHATLNGCGPCPSDCPCRAHLPTLPPLYQENLLIRQDSVQAGPALEAHWGPPVWRRHPSLAVGVELCPLCIHTIKS